MDETAPIGNQHVTPSGAARRSELRHALRQRPYRTGNGTPSRSTL